MTEHFEPTTFTRHNRFIHTLLLDSQVWLSATDLGRMMGYPLDDRATRKLDPDQTRRLWLHHHGQQRETLMVSESGMYALLVYHQIPENRSLRHWLTHEVVPALRATEPKTAQNPNLSTLQWQGHSVDLLHWQSEPWVRWGDVPVLARVAEG